MWHRKVPKIIPQRITKGHVGDLNTYSKESQIATLLLSVGQKIRLLNNKEGISYVKSIYKE